MSHGDGADSLKESSLTHTIRKYVLLAAAALWGFAVSLAFQKGWLDPIPDWVVGLLFIIPVLLVLFWFWTHDKVKEYRRFIHTRPRMSYFVLSLIGALLGWGIMSFGWWTVHRQPHQEAKAAPAQTPAPTPQPTPAGPAFSVEVRSAFVSDSGPLTLYMVGYSSILGPTASPVLYLAYVQITNLQDVPSTVSEFRVAVSKEAEGPWEDLVPIPLDAVTLYSLGGKPTVPKLLSMSRGTSRLATQMKASDMKQVMLLKAEPHLALQFVRPIEPHHAVSGWVALDSLRHVGLTPGQIFFRIMLRDTAGKGDKYVAELPRRAPGDSAMGINNGSLLVTAQLVDISNFKVKYYGDPFPTPAP